MGNHVHLLVTPDSQDGCSNLANAVAVRYQRYAAERHGCTESVWNGVPEIHPVYARRYLFACMRYIELNPVRANIVARPESYRWTSYRANALGYIDPIVTPHPLYYTLGRSPEARCAAYARFVDRGFPRPDRVSP